jgi:dipeptidase
VWVAQYAPHHSSYVPLYVGVQSTPWSLDNVTYYKFDKSKNFWVHSVVGNYVSRWFKWTIGDVQAFQVLVYPYIVSSINNGGMNVM